MAFSTLFHFKTKINNDMNLGRIDLTLQGYKEIMSEIRYIDIAGAKEHNLKAINVRIPHRSLTVITGVSGSGKSSLAYDTLYAEGQRRYVESLSTYARQFLGKIDKPRVQWIKGIAPTVAIRQKTVSGNARSTVGTVTEIYDYLKLLFARIGVTVSPVSGKPVKKHTAEDVLNFIRKQETGSRWLITVRLPETERDPKQVLQILKNQNYERVLYAHSIVNINDWLARKDAIPPANEWELIVDRIVVEQDESYLNRISESVETAFFQGHGHLGLIHWETKKRYDFSNKFEADGMEFPEPSVHLFSFNNPYGACPVCEGFGSVIDIAPEKVIPDENKSIYEGAVAPWSGNKLGKYREALVRHAHKFDFPVHTPWKDLTPEQKELVWNGNEYFTGIRDFFAEIEAKSYKIQNRVLLARYRGKTICPACRGKRLRPEAFNVFTGGKNIGDLVEMSIDELSNFFANLSLTKNEIAIAQRLLPEIRSRLHFLKQVGLGYLTLNRPMMTLSGGESQRVRLAVSLGSGLTGAIYVLDEPSIGLHVRDTKRLIEVLKNLRDRGNTVVVVEHEEAVMRAADHIIDLGPEAGVFGGEVVAEGNFEQIRSSNTLTGWYLSGKTEVPVPDFRRTSNDFIELKGARLHNLKNINVRIPLHTLTVVTGVSGSGKSSLIADTLYPALHRAIHGHGPMPGPFDKLEGAWKTIGNVDFSGQETGGRSSRSNPVTYIGVYDEIRQLMAEQKRAKFYRFTPRHFSFNVPGGRCPNCKGEGTVTEEMQFMADLKITCEVCKGKRFIPEVLEVTFHGKNIYDILELSVDEAVAFFEQYGQTSIVSKLKILQETGLGYVQLGQSTSTFSGGELQRLKLALHLVKGTKMENTLFIFDEPTTGLHFHDINKLLKAFNRLIENGHSIVVIEHNLDFIKAADYVIDLGPEGGAEGGYLIFQGTPEALVNDGQSLLAPYLKEKLRKKP